MEFVFEPIELEVAFAQLPKIETASGGLSYEDFLGALEANVNPSVLSKGMGAPKLHGDYVLFQSPFKLLETGEPDKTGSLVFKWSTGEWWDNSAGKNLLERSQGCNYGTLYRFFAYFGQTVSVKDNFNKETGVLKYNAILERKHIAKEKNLPSELIYQHFHNQMMRIPVELLRSKKPFWAKKFVELCALEGIGYDAERRRLLFFFFDSKGIANKVHTYPLEGGDKTYTTLEALAKRTSDDHGTISGNLFITSPDFNTFTVRNYQSEEFQKQTLFFTEGEPDAITIALCGFHAASFKNLTRNGEIVKNSPLANIKVADSYTIADVGSETDAKIFAEIVSTNIPESKLIELKPEHFNPMSPRLLPSGELISNTDITNLLEEKDFENPELVGETILELLRSATLARATQVAYNPEAIIPTGNTAEERSLRNERVEFSWKKAQSNLLVSEEDSTQVKLKRYLERINNGEDYRGIQLGVYSDASLHDSLVFVKGVLQKANNTVDIQTYRFNCSEFVSGELNVRDCMGCPVYKTRRDLARISSSWSQTDDTRDVPPFEGLWRFGSNAAKRMIGLTVLTDKKRALKANGIICSEAHIQNETMQDTFLLSIGVGAVKAILDPSCKDVTREDLVQNLGMPVNVMGYFAPVWDDTEYVNYFVIMGVKESEEVVAQEVLDAAKIIRNEEFSLANLARIKKSFPEWKLEDSEKAVFLTALDFMKVAGYYAPYHLVLTLLASALSGTEIGFPKYFRKEYIGASFFIFGEASSGKTYLSRVALLLLHGANVGTSMANLQAGEFRASALKGSSFTYGATTESIAMKKDPAPLQVKNNGNFLVIDEVSNAIPGLTHDVIGQVLWEGTTTKAGILNETFSIGETITKNNVDSKTPFLMLGNIADLKVSKPSDRKFVPERDENFHDSRFAAQATISATSMWKTLGLLSPDMAYKRITPISVSRLDAHSNFCQWVKMGFQGKIPFAKREEPLSVEELTAIVKGFWSSVAYVKSRRVGYVDLDEEKLFSFVEQISKRNQIGDIVVDPVSVRRRILAFANLCSICRGDSEITESDLRHGTELFLYVLECSYIFEKENDQENLVHDKCLIVGQPYARASIRSTDLNRIPYTYILERRTSEEREKIYELLQKMIVQSGSFISGKVVCERSILEMLLRMFISKFPEYKGMTLEDFLHSRFAGNTTSASFRLECHVCLLRRIGEIERMDNVSLARWANFHNYENALKFYQL